ncbi:MAG: hypothetical protein ACI9S8_002896 [Chlamydiales bacterium]|jgi:hypothetical protein
MSGIIGNNSVTRPAEFYDEIHLSEAIKERISIGERVHIYEGMGYSEIIGRFQDGRVKSVEFGPIEVTAADIALKDSIEKCTRVFQLEVNLGRAGWKGVSLSSPLYSPHALCLGAELISPQLMKALTSYSVGGVDYYIDFSRMKQVRADNPNLSRDVRWIQS